MRDWIEVQSVTRCHIQVCNIVAVANTSRLFSRLKTRIITTTNLDFYVEETVEQVLQKIAEAANEQNND